MNIKESLKKSASLVFFISIIIGLATCLTLFLSGCSKQQNIENTEANTVIDNSQNTVEKEIEPIRCKVVDIRETTFGQGEYSRARYRIVVILEDFYGKRAIVDIVKNDLPDVNDEDNAFNKIRELVPGDIVYYYSEGTELRIERIVGAKEIVEDIETVEE